MGEGDKRKQPGKKDNVARGLIPQGMVYVGKFSWRTEHALFGGKNLNLNHVQVTLAASDHVFPQKQIGSEACKEGKEQVGTQVGTSRKKPTSVKFVVGEGAAEAHKMTDKIGSQQQRW